MAGVWSVITLVFHEHVTTVAPSQAHFVDELVEVSVSCREFQCGMLPAILKTYRHPQSERQYFYDRVFCLQNNVLLEKFRDQKLAWLEAGYSDEEVKERYAFLHVNTEHEARELCRVGIAPGNVPSDGFGNPNRGVHLCRHADVLRPHPLANGSVHYMVICKLLMGRVKQVPGIHRLEPTAAYDSYMPDMNGTNKAQLSPEQLFNCTQVYVCGPEGQSAASLLPQICPVAVIHFHCIDDGHRPMDNIPRVAPQPSINQRSDHIVWTGKLSIKSLFACPVQMLSNTDMEKPTHLGLCMNITCKIGVCDAQKKYLRSVPCLSHNTEVFWDGWHYNVCLLQPIHSRSNFDKLINYLEKTDSMAVLKLDGETLLLTADNGVTTRLGLTPPDRRGSPHDKKLHCIVISTKSWKKNRKVMSDSLVPDPTLSPLQILNAITYSCSSEQQIQRSPASSSTYPHTDSLCRPEVGRSTTATVLPGPILPAIEKHLCTSISTSHNIHSVKTSDPFCRLDDHVDSCHVVRDSSGSGDSLHVHPFTSPQYDMVSSPGLADSSIDSQFTCEPVVDELTKPHVDRDGNLAMADLVAEACEACYTSVDEESDLSANIPFQPPPDYASKLTEALTISSQDHSAKLVDVILPANSADDQLFYDFKTAVKQELSDGATGQAVAEHRVIGVVTSEIPVSSIPPDVIPTCTSGPVGPLFENLKNELVNSPSLTAVISQKVDPTDTDGGASTHPQLSQLLQQAGRDMGLLLSPVSRFPGINSDTTHIPPSEDPRLASSPAADLPLCLSTKTFQPSKYLQFPFSPRPDQTLGILPHPQHIDVSTFTTAKGLHLHLSEHHLGGLSSLGTQAGQDVDAGQQLTTEVSDTLIETAPVTDVQSPIPSPLDLTIPHSNVDSGFLQEPPASSLLQYKTVKECFANQQYMDSQLEFEQRPSEVCINGNGHIGSEEIVTNDTHVNKNTENEDPLYKLVSETNPADKTKDRVSSKNIKKESSNTKTDTVNGEPIKLKIKLVKHSKSTTASRDSAEMKKDGHAPSSIKLKCKENEHQISISTESSGCVIPDQTKDEKNKKCSRKVIANRRLLGKDCVVRLHDILAPGALTTDKLLAKLAWQDCDRNVAASPTVTINVEKTSNSLGDELSIAEHHPKTKPVPSTHSKSGEKSNSQENISKKQRHKSCIGKVGMSHNDNQPEGKHTPAKTKICSSKDGRERKRHKSVVEISDKDSKSRTDTESVHSSKVTGKEKSEKKVINKHDKDKHTDKKSTVSESNKDNNKTFHNEDLTTISEPVFHNTTMQTPVHTAGDVTPSLESTAVKKKSRSPSDELAEMIEDFRKKRSKSHTTSTSQKTVAPKRRWEHKDVPEDAKKVKIEYKVGLKKDKENREKHEKCHKHKKTPMKSAWSDKVLSQVMGTGTGIQRLGRIPKKKALQAIPGSDGNFAGKKSPAEPKSNKMYRGSKVTSATSHALINSTDNIPASSTVDSDSERECIDDNEDLHGTLHTEGILHMSHQITETSLYRDSKQIQSENDKTPISDKLQKEMEKSNPVFESVLNPVSNNGSIPGLGDFSPNTIAKAQTHIQDPIVRLKSDEKRSVEKKDDTLCISLTGFVSEYGQVTEDQGKSGGLSLEWLKAGLHGVRSESQPLPHSAVILVNTVRCSLHGFSKMMGNRVCIKSKDNQSQLKYTVSVDVLDNNNTDSKADNANGILWKSTTGKEFDSVSSTLDSIINSAKAKIASKCLSSKPDLVLNIPMIPGSVMDTDINDEFAADFGDGSDNIAIEIEPETDVCKKASSSSTKPSKGGVCLQSPETVKTLTATTATMPKSNDGHVTVSQPDTTSTTVKERITDTVNTSATNDSTNERLVLFSSGLTAASLADYQSESTRTSPSETPTESHRRRSSEKNSNSKQDNRSPKRSEGKTTGHRDERISRSRSGSKELAKDSIDKRLVQISKKTVSKEEAQKADDRHSRQYHPYKRETKKTPKKRRNVPSWSFDMAYRDLNELLQNLTTNSFKIDTRKPLKVSNRGDQRSKRGYHSSQNVGQSARRFCSYKFIRSTVPRTVPRSQLSSSSESDEEEAVTPDIIPNIEERGKKADMLDNMFMETKEEEGFNVERCVYVKEQIEESSGKNISVTSSEKAKLASAAKKSITQSKDILGSPLVIPGGPKSFTFSSCAIDLENEASLELLDSADTRILECSEEGKISDLKPHMPVKLNSKPAQVGSRDEAVNLNSIDETIKKRISTEATNPSESIQDESNNNKSKTKPHDRHLLSSESDTNLDYIDEELALDNILLLPSITESGDEFSDTGHCQRYIVVDALGDTDSDATVPLRAKDEKAIAELRKSHNEIQDSDLGSDDSALENYTVIDETYDETIKAIDETCDDDQDSIHEENEEALYTLDEILSECSDRSNMQEDICATKCESVQELNEVDDKCAITGPVTISKNTVCNVNTVISSKKIENSMDTISTLADHVSTTYLSSELNYDSHGRQKDDNVSCTLNDDSSLKVYNKREVESQVIPSLHLEVTKNLSDEKKILPPQFADSDNFGQEKETIINSAVEKNVPENIQNKDENVVSDNHNTADEFKVFCNEEIECTVEEIVDNNLDYELEVHTTCHELPDFNNNDSCTSAKENIKYFVTCKGDNAETASEYSHAQSKNSNVYTVLNPDIIVDGKKTTVADKSMPSHEDINIHPDTLSLQEVVSEDSRPAIKINDSQCGGKNPSEINSNSLKYSSLSDLQASHCHESDRAVGSCSDCPDIVLGSDEEMVILQKAVKEVFTESVCPEKGLDVSCLSKNMNKSYAIVTECLSPVQTIHPDNCFQSNDTFQNRGSVTVQLISPTKREQKPISSEVGTDLQNVIPVCFSNCKIDNQPLCSLASSFSVVHPTSAEDTSEMLAHNHSMFTNLPPSLLNMSLQHPSFVSPLLPTPQFQSRFSYPQTTSFVSVPQYPSHLPLFGPHTPPTGYQPFSQSPPFMQSPPFSHNGPMPNATMYPNDSSYTYRVPYIYQRRGPSQAPQLPNWFWQKENTTTSSIHPWMISGNNMTPFLRNRPDTFCLKAFYNQAHILNSPKQIQDVPEHDFMSEMYFTNKSPDEDVSAGSMESSMPKSDIHGPQTLKHLSEQNIQKNTKPVQRDNKGCSADAKQKELVSSLPGENDEKPTKDNKLKMDKAITDEPSNLLKVKCSSSAVKHAHDVQKNYTSMELDRIGMIWNGIPVGHVPSKQLAEEENEFPLEFNVERMLKKTKSEMTATSECFSNESENHLTHTCEVVKDQHASEHCSLLKLGNRSCDKQIDHLIIETNNLPTKSVSNFVTESKEINDPCTSIAVYVNTSKKPEKLYSPLKESRNEVMLHKNSCNSEKEIIFVVADTYLHKESINYNVKNDISSSNGDAQIHCKNNADKVLDSEYSILIVPPKTGENTESKFEKEQVNDIQGDERPLVNIYSIADQLQSTSCTKSSMLNTDRNVTNRSSSVVSNEQSKLLCSPKTDGSTNGVQMCLKNTDYKSEEIRVVNEATEKSTHKENTPATVTALILAKNKEDVNNAAVCLTAIGSHVLPLQKQTSSEIMTLANPPATSDILSHQNIDNVKACSGDDFEFQCNLIEMEVSSQSDLKVIPKSYRHTKNNTSGILTNVSKTSYHSLDEDELIKKHCADSKVSTANEHRVKLPNARRKRGLKKKTSFQKEHNSLDIESELSLFYSELSQDEQSDAMSDTPSVSTFNSIAHKQELQCKKCSGSNALTLVSASYSEDDTILREEDIVNKKQLDAVPLKLVDYNGDSINTADTPSRNNHIKISDTPSVSTFNSIAHTQELQYKKCSGSNALTLVSASYSEDDTMLREEDIVKKKQLDAVPLKIVDYNEDGMKTADTPSSNNHIKISESNDKVTKEITSGYFSCTETANEISDAHAQIDNKNNADKVLYSKYSISIVSPRTGENTESKHEKAQADDIEGGGTADVKYNSLETDIALFHSEIVKQENEEMDTKLCCSTNIGGEKQLVNIHSIADQLQPTSSTLSSMLTTDRNITNRSSSGLSNSQKKPLCSPETDGATTGIQMCLKNTDLNKSEVIPVLNETTEKNSNKENTPATPFSFADNKNKDNLNNAAVCFTAIGSHVLQFQKQTSPNSMTKAHPLATSNTLSHQNIDNIKVCSGVDSKFQCNSIEMEVSSQSDQEDIPKCYRHTQNNTSKIVANVSKTTNHSLDKDGLMKTQCDKVEQIADSKICAANEDGVKLTNAKRKRGRKKKRFQKEHNSLDLESELSLFYSELSQDEQSDAMSDTTTASTFDTIAHKQEFQYKKFSDSNTLTLVNALYSEQETNVREEDIINKRKLDDVCLKLVDYNEDSMETADTPLSNDLGQISERNDALTKLSKGSLPVGECTLTQLLNKSNGYPQGKDTDATFTMNSNTTCNSCSTSKNNNAISKYVINSSSVCNTCATSKKDGTEKSKPVNYNDKNMSEKTLTNLIDASKCNLDISCNLNVNLNGHCRSTSSTSSFDKLITGVQYKDAYLSDLPISDDEFEHSTVCNTIQSDSLNITETSESNSCDPALTSVQAVENTADLKPVAKYDSSLAALAHYSGNELDLSSDSDQTVMPDYSSENITCNIQTNTADTEKSAFDNNGTKNIIYQTEKLFRCKWTEQDGSASEILSGGSDTGLDDDSISKSSTAFGSDFPAVNSNEYANLSPMTSRNSNSCHSKRQHSLTSMAQYSTDDSSSVVSFNYGTNRKPSLPTSDKGNDYFADAKTCKISDSPNPTLSSSFSSSNFEKYNVPLMSLEKFSSPSNLSQCSLTNLIEKQKLLVHELGNDNTDENCSNKEVSHVEPNQQVSSKDSSFHPILFDPLRSISDGMCTRITNYGNDTSDYVPCTGYSSREPTLAINSPVSKERATKEWVNRVVEVMDEKSAEKSENIRKNEKVTDVSQQLLRSDIARNVIHPQYDVLKSPSEISIRNQTKLRDTKSSGLSGCSFITIDKCNSDFCKDELVDERKEKENICVRSRLEKYKHRDTGRQRCSSRIGHSSDSSSVCNEDADFGRCRKSLRESNVISSTSSRSRADSCSSSSSFRSESSSQHKRCSRSSSISHASGEQMLDKRNWSNGVSIRNRSLSTGRARYKSPDSYVGFRSDDWRGRYASPNISRSGSSPRKATPSPSIKREQSHTPLRVQFISPRMSKGSPHVRRERSRTPHYRRHAGKTTEQNLQRTHHETSKYKEVVSLKLDKGTRSVKVHCRERSCGHNISELPSRKTPDTDVFGTAERCSSTLNDDRKFKPRSPTPVRIERSRSQKPDLHSQSKNSITVETSNDMQRRNVNQRLENLVFLHDAVFSCWENNDLEGLLKAMDQFSTRRCWWKIVVTSAQICKLATERMENPDAGKLLETLSASRELGNMELLPKGDQPIVQLAKQQKASKPNVGKVFVITGNIDMPVTDSCPVLCSRQQFLDHHLCSQ